MTLIDSPFSLRGEVALGPDRYRRVVLDDVTVAKVDGLHVMTGVETRIVVREETLRACAGKFYEGAVAMLNSLAAGGRPHFAQTEAAGEELERVLAKRLIEGMAPPPSDGRAYTIHAEFWEGFCPPEMNTKRYVLLDVDNLAF